MTALFDPAEHYRARMGQYADALDHVLAIGELHAEGECVTCDWLRIRPTRAFRSVEEADRYQRSLELPRHAA